MKIAKIRNVKTPTRGTRQSAGIDFYVPEDLDWEIKTLRPNESVLIPSGIKVSIARNLALIAFNKSGVATKKGLQVGACVIDSDYQGEIHIHLTNVSNKETHISQGEKIVQFVLLPVWLDTPEVVHIDDLYKEVSQRGTGGFGSTDLDLYNYGADRY